MRELKSRFCSNYEYKKTFRSISKNMTYPIPVLISIIEETLGSSLIFISLFGHSSHRGATAIKLRGNNYLLLAFKILSNLDFTKQKIAFIQLSPPAITNFLAITANNNIKVVNTSIFIFWLFCSKYYSLGHVSLFIPEHFEGKSFISKSLIS